MSEAISSKQDAIEGVVYKRVKDLVEFLEEMGQGSLRQAKALWVLKRVHLSEHVVNYYFRIVIDSGVIEVAGDGMFRFKFNPFTGKRYETATTPNETATEYMQRRDREKKSAKIREDFRRILEEW